MPIFSGIEIFPGNCNRTGNGATETLPGGTGIDQCYLSQNLPQFAGRDIQLRLQGDPVSSAVGRDSVPLPCPSERLAARQA